ncbi:MAG: TlpA family protein disulfide reductase [Acidobacteria bacterium]|nr:TlpA family protein disulfide reductase [Acidobacteriota bacterium]
MKNRAGTERRFWTGARVALAGAAFAGVALVASGCKSNDTANLTANSSPKTQPTVTITRSQPGQPAQPQQPPQLETVPAAAWNTEIQAVDGAKFRLSDYKDKVVVVDLWATWCGPCRMEIPHLVDLQKEYGGKGVEVIGLTTEDPESDEAKVRDFAKEFKINYKLGWSPRDVSIALMNGNQSIPQTFVIAPGGRIVTKFRGFSDRIPDMIRAAIDKANEKTGD